MKITHIFRSGNSCELDVPDSMVRGQALDMNCRWERFPPSAADLREYREIVYSEKILPAFEKALGSADGRRWVEIEPGIRILVDREQVQ
jgi:hypothetical protein